MGFFKNLFKTKNKKQTLLQIPTNKKKSWNLSGLFSTLSSDNQDAILSTLEEKLVTSDVSIKSTIDILTHIQNQIFRNPQVSPEKTLIDYLSHIIPEQHLVLDKEHLNIIFIFGVNGVGKTTSVGKLGHFLKGRGEDIVFAAADTYRAAAVNQLKVWAERTESPIIFHEGKSKPAAVVYDAVESAIARKRTVLLIDTAGRFHNRDDLLEELNKLQRIIKEKAPHAKVQNLLVLDSTTGQNAFEQAKHFHSSVGISGVFLSKWDSSGKGGIVITLGKELELPVYFVGVGESIENIAIFNREEYIDEILN